MGFHIVGSYRPLSKFMIPLLILMWMASVVFLCQYPVTLLFTVAHLKIRER